MEGLYNLRHKGTPDAACDTSKCLPAAHQNYDHSSDNKFYQKNGNTTGLACCTFSEQAIADCTLGGADTCQKGGEPHDGVLLVTSKFNGVLNTEGQYPYTSGHTGKLSRCSPKAGGVTTGITG